MPDTPKKRPSRRLLIAAAAGLVLIGAAATFVHEGGAYRMMHHGGSHASGHGGGHGGGHGNDHGGGHSGGHDEVRMPGLQGANATALESAELATLFRNFETLSREVTNLPDGIRTVTRSSDPEVMNQLVSHVVGMIDRVDTGDDPQIRIQSPTLDIFFVKGSEITSEIDITEAGVIVIQTSTDAEVVKALQTHAAEVTAMVERGMAAVHEMMMRGH